MSSLAISNSPEGPHSILAFERMISLGTGTKPGWGYPKTPLLAQLREALRLLGTAGPHPGCIKAGAGRAANYSTRCNVCPPAFPRRITVKKGQEFDLSRPAPLRRCLP